MALLRPFSILVVFILHSAIGGTSPLNEQHIISDIDSTTSNAGYKVRKELWDAEIIPTVIDDFIPPLLLNARWPHHHTHASLGNTLKPSKLDSAPSITLEGYNQALNNWKEGMTYVITLTDPDAPSRDDPKWSEFCHWIAVGVSVSSHNRIGVDFHHDDDSEIMEYKPPSPPERTGKHRYVLLAFAPANGTTEKLHLSKPSGRKHWGYDVDGDGKKRERETKGVREWAAENGLVPVGESSHLKHAREDADMW
ncbi:phosphatidylethanolamine-binding protein [Apiosordaria backusii]|uniref:Phosphatidylethanolamine-binding protein n=1 Tax=Apiosordaria backusii TaxID=314023 RepID=A0AA40EDU0_9PEZI|nr:phosphatidylethanolamine-binding protein [Apiosordaria backusii]